MTITPTPLVPAPAAGTTSAAVGTGKGKGEQAAATGFGALLAQLAGALSHGKAGAAGQGGATGETETGAMPGSAEMVEGEESTSAPLAVLPGAATVAPVPGLPGAASVAAGSEPALVPGGGASLAETAIRGVAGTAAAAASGTGQPALVQPQPGQGQLAAGQTGPATGGETTGQTLVDGPSAAPAMAEPASAAAVPAAGNDGGSTAQTQLSQVSAAGNAAAPGSASSATATATAAPAASSPSPLLDQVTPVVSRMVSAGEGSHRMVLRLHPADLGEVQLTVTVRGESVDVTVAAGTEARELMTGGSSELRALLDSIGRTAGNITFKELPGAPQIQSAPAGFPTTGQEAGQSGTTYAGADTDRDGTGRGDGARRHAAADQRTATTADLPEGTGTPTRSPGSGALDVRI